MLVYLIKHLPTGLWMPNLGQGATHWEPTIPRTGTWEEKRLANRRQWTAGPRIFYRLVDAKNARDWWLQGAFNNDPEEGYPVPESAIVAEMRPPRHESELEIWPAKLISTFSGLELK